MKFAKQLETEAENIPLEWRPYLIQYKALKKMITKVTQEIESRGLSASLLHECLYDNNIKYHFTGNHSNINIKRRDIHTLYQESRLTSSQILNSSTTKKNLKYKRSCLD